MTDLEIVQMIEHYITELVADDTKYRREIRVLLKLKTAIEARMQSSLNHQAERALAQRQ
jgi:hypothetical protein